MLCVSARGVLEYKSRLGQMRGVICYPVSAWKTFYKCRKSIKQANIDNTSASIMSQPHEIEFASASQCLIALDESMIFSNC